MNYRAQIAEARRRRDELVERATNDAWAGYRAQVAEARRRRDELIERATADARTAIAEAGELRDAEILRLAAQGLSAGAIAPLVGCSRAVAYERLHDDRRGQYNERRREHWRHLHAVA